MYEHNLNICSIISFSIQNISNVYKNLYLKPKTISLKAAAVKATEQNQIRLIYCKSEISRDECFPFESLERKNFQLDMLQRNTKIKVQNLTRVQSEANDQSTCNCGVRIT